LFVLTLTESLAMVWTPLPVGVALIDTVPLLLTLIVEPIAELMVVVAVAASTAAGKTITKPMPTMASDPDNTSFISFFIFMIDYLS
jgi:hypothetical protein